MTKPRLFFIVLPALVAMWSASAAAPAASASTTNGEKTPSVRQTGAKPRALVDQAKDGSGFDWDTELSFLAQSTNLFHQIRISSRQDEARQIFELKEIKAALFDEQGSGTIIYEGEPWVVGESREFGGREIVLEHLIAPTGGTLGKARFVQGQVSREVDVGAASPGVTRPSASNGWLIGDGREVMVPAEDRHQKGRRVTVYFKDAGRSVPGRIRDVSDGWCFVSISVDPIAAAPKLRAPSAQEVVLVTATDGTVTELPAAMLEEGEIGQHDLRADQLRGAVITTRDGALVGFFAPTLPLRLVAGDSSGEGSFLPAARAVQVVAR